MRKETSIIIITKLKYFRYIIYVSKYTFNNLEWKKI